MPSCLGKQDILLVMNHCYWWHFIKTGRAWRRKNQMFCWDLHSRDVLSSWIFLTPSFEKFSHLPGAHLYCEVDIYKFLCSSRWKFLCLHKSSFCIYFCHPLTFINLTWKLFMCKRKQVKILIASPYQSKINMGYLAIPERLKGYMKESHWQSCFYSLPYPGFLLPFFSPQFPILWTNGGI